MKPLIGITGDIEDRNGKTYLYIDLRYGKMVEEAGGIPVLLHPAESIGEVVSKIDGLLLSGGEDIHPRYYGEEPQYPMTLSPDLRTEFETSLLKESMEKSIPVLGICHGMQLINVVLGGSLYQDLPLQKSDVMEHRLKDKRHLVDVDGDSLLYRIFGIGEIDVTSTHHQAVKEIGKGLESCATARDGVVEAFEKPDYPFLMAVQWHPEKDPDEVSRRLFSSFIKSCK